jgi:spore coat polysaccharide biosynthesis protein SpsF
VKRVVVIVQARTGSTRLPGKVMRTLGGEPVLARMLERLEAASIPSEIAVATTTAPEDEPIRALCRRLGVRVESGHPTDCLDRHRQVAGATGADVAVKIPSDCPLIDPAVVDRVIGAFLAGDFDYVSNLHPQSYPDGCDVEVVSRDALEVAARQAIRPLEREHTTPFLWDQPDRFRLGNVTWEAGRDCSRTHRLTLDHEEDLVLLDAVFQALWTHERPIFPLGDIVALLDRDPTLRAINARHAGTIWYRNHPGELRTVEVT